ncbi:MAG TPA: hypothetical protein VKP30_22505 [Polyangiaceae bacterium]|nr:hypothetical protein [Polyangiaceae bacterium]
MSHANANNVTPPASDAAIGAGGSPPILLTAATVLGAIGVAASYVAVSQERFWINWIYWFVVLFTVGIGSLFIVALQHLVSARWSIPIRRVPERLATLLLPATPAALIGLLAVRVLYPGAKPEALQNKLLAGKAFWLDLPFFSARTIVVLAASLIALAILVRGSMRQDTTKDPLFSLLARKFSPLFMVMFAFIVTFVAFDWIGGLVPEWYSDILGVYLFAGAFLSALASTTLVTLFLKARHRLTEVRGDHLYNLGGFTFAFTVFWSYIAFAQYMLMWYADLPEEVHWYHERLHGGWHPLTIILAIIHFVVPFFALSTRDAKSDPKRLARVGLLMLGAHLLDVYWLLFPILGHGPVFSWPELSFALLFLGIGLLWVHRALRWGADMPIGDPFLREGLEFRL